MQRILSVHLLRGRGASLGASSVTPAAFASAPAGPRGIRIADLRQLHLRRPAPCGQLRRVRERGKRARAGRHDGVLSLLIQPPPALLLDSVQRAPSLPQQRSKHWHVLRRRAVHLLSDSGASGASSFTASAVGAAGPGGIRIADLRHMRRRRPAPCGQPRRVRERGVGARAERHDAHRPRITKPASVLLVHSWSALPEQPR